MSIFYHPPQPFQGGKQPLEGRKLAPETPVQADDPPFSSRRLTVAALLISLCQPSDLNSIDIYQSLINPERIDQPIPSLPNKNTLAAIHNSWISDPPLPQFNRFVASLIIPAPVDDPPFNSRDLKTQVYVWHIPPDPALTGDRQPSGGGPKLNPSLLHAQVDDPPFDGRPSQDPVWIWHNYKHSIPLTQSIINPTELNVREAPSSRAGILSLTHQSWISVPVQPQTTRFIAPLVDVAAPVNDPPFSYQHFQQIDAWIAPFVLPQGSAKYPQEFVAQADNPPFDGKDHLSGILSAWQIETLPQQRVNKLIVSVDDPPRKLRDLTSTLISWQPQEFASQKFAKYVPEGVVVNDPPFGLKFWLFVVQDAWVLTPPSPILPRHLIQEFIPPPVNEPPPIDRRWYNIIADVWQQLPDRLPEQFQTQPPFVNAGGTRFLFLPDAIKDPVHRYWFYVIDTRSLRVVTKPGTITDYIRMEGAICPIGGYIEGLTLGGSIMLSCNKDHEWNVMTKLGTWTLST